ncbi:MAG: hypothetical protein CML20_04270 [Rheinheimera sp.]|uniref:DUF58 domain-containing protein n=1 Tax=Arsukibacterium sp. UBA3155 TaxID=1946058 RepID=UPI000C8F57D6|nr:DUF58 domain-containing protein [Arsukibacterium sp. UBA3155]MAD74004.1 hypothetical protein [Rheinheimera sp.]|tara:strand:- start:60259 stop:61590 length:1332 start_codon:yes stop_codon:yes gene_type:complete
MKPLTIRPSNRLLLALAALVVLSIVLKILQSSQAVQLATIGGLFGLILLKGRSDFTRLKRLPPLTVQRELPDNLNLNCEFTYQLIIENHTEQTLLLSAAERMPAHWLREQRQFSSRLAAKEKLKFTYQVKPSRRGLVELSGTDFRLQLPGGFWQSRYHVSAQHQVKVYPDFSVLMKSPGLSGVGNLPVPGIKVFNKRGSGTEFRHLREYRLGDSQNQIDWQASSRRLKLIAREFQEEQSQQVIVMLDSGRRMHVETEIGTHFDAALSAILLLAHSVLKNGDWFSMQSFGATERWLPNVRSVRDISKVMQHFYDLYPSDISPDYLVAARQLISKKPKRALVLIVTTLQDEDFSDLLPAVRLLQQHHLIGVIHIENEAIRQQLSHNITDSIQAKSYLGAVQLNQLFQQNWQRLQKEHVLCISSRAKDLLPQSLNAYLRVKRSGML